MCNGWKRSLHDRYQILMLIIIPTHSHISIRLPHLTQLPRHPPLRRSHLPHSSRCTPRSDPAPRSTANANPTQPSLRARQNRKTRNWLRFRCRRPPRGCRCQHFTHILFVCILRYLRPVIPAHTRRVRVSPLTIRPAHPGKRSAACLGLRGGLTVMTQRRAGTSH